jgi:hypothetical protein
VFCSDVKREDLQAEGAKRFDLNRRVEGSRVESVDGATWRHRETTFWGFRGGEGGPPPICGCAENAGVKQRFCASPCKRVILSGCGMCRCEAVSHL